MSEGERSRVRVRIAGATDVGLVREHNEDSFLIVDLDSGVADVERLRDYPVGQRGTLLLVCDGMGGAAAGEVASAMAVQGMRRVLQREFGISNEELPEGLAADEPAGASAEGGAGWAVGGGAGGVGGGPGGVGGATGAAAAGAAAQSADEGASSSGGSGGGSMAAAGSSPGAAGGASPGAVSDGAAGDAAGAVEGGAAKDAAGEVAPGGAVVSPAAADAAGAADEEGAVVVGTAVEVAAPAADAGAAAADAAPGDATTPTEAASALPAGDASGDNAFADAAPVDDAGGDVMSLARRLRDAVYAVNLEIFSAACADVTKAGMGTTLTGLLLRPDRVIVAQVGDSRAYLWRRGVLTQITHDQSLVNQLLDSGQITPDQAKLFEHSNVILQALGVQEDVEVLISTESLRQGDRVLLCSDGLVGVVSDEEIQEVLGLSENLDDTVRTLIDMARAAGGPDNITVIVAEVSGDGIPPAEPEDSVHYRTLALDPPASYGGGDSGRGQGLSPPAPSFEPSPPITATVMLSMAWVVGLLLAGLLVSVLIYPRSPGRAPPRGGLCYFVADRPGLEILVDDEAQPQLTSLPGIEVRLGPGPHSVALRDGTGPTPLLSERQAVHVSPGQRCALRLRAPRGRNAKFPALPPPVE